MTDELGRIVKVLGDNVLVKDIEPMEKGCDGIYFPEMIKDGSRRYDAEIGTVESVGEDVEDLEPGMKVYLAPMKGKEYGNMKLYKFEEIFGVIE